MLLIPDDMVQACGKVFEGEYDISYSVDNPIILDIGANIGAFAAWAQYRWSNATIYCYEPVAENFRLLVQNTENRKGIHCINKAIGEKDEDKRLIYYGLQNRGQCGFHQTPEQREYGEYVSVMAASSLPQAHIVKIDTEGSEIEILANMRQKPHVYLLEYHSPSKKKAIEQLLPDYTKVESKMDNIVRGTVKYIRTDVLMDQLDDRSKELLKHY